MVTYTDVDASSIDAVEVYSDAGLTSLVESLSVSDIGTGLYEATAALDLDLYEWGRDYYLKITYTPSGAAQRSQTFVIRPLPQGRAASSASTTDTSCADGTHIQPPLLQFRLGRGSFREEDLENATYASSRDRTMQVLPMPDGKKGDVLHLVLSNARAGEPFALAGVSALVQAGDIRSTEQEGGLPIDIPVMPQPGAPGWGYRASSFSLSHLLRRSRNLSLHTDVPRRRAGYRIVRSVSGASGYHKRLPVNRINGTQQAAIQIGTTIYEDGAPPTSRYTGLTDPYGATDRRVHKNVYFRGKQILVGGSDADNRVLVFDGSQLYVRAPWDDADTPTVAANGSGSSLTVQTWYVRIREYDEKTNSYSGPSQRTATAVSVTPTSGQRIQVDFSAANTRATHWQIEIASADLPGSYQIVYDPRDGTGSALGTADSVGRIEVGTTTAYIYADPASGDAFPYRQVRGVSVYRHGKIPTGAAYIAQFNGKIFYAPHDDTWLVWSESGDPEAFYHDPSDPSAGFNTMDGEGLIDTVASPCRGLAATETALFYFTELSVIVWSGSFYLAVGTDGTADYRGRDARSDILAQGSSGLVGSAVRVVDQDVYLFTQDGPGVISGGGLLALDPEAVRADWECRDRAHETRYHIGYSPRHRLLLFAFVSKDAPISGVPDKVLAWHVEKGQWCPPWDLLATSFTLDISESGSDPDGLRLYMGGPYGQMLEYGYGDGDGEDGSDADAADLESTSATSTTATVSGKSWTADEWKGCSVVLTDRTTGRRYYRVISTNTTDTLTWEGSATDSGGGWLINIGGIPGTFHTLIARIGKALSLVSLRVWLHDLLGIET